MMSKDLVGKHAFVTGASGGIGRAIALSLAEAGARVSVHFSSGAERAAETASLIQDVGGEATVVQADLRDPVAHAALVESLVGPVDILVNNAGIACGSTLAATSIEDYDRVFDTNVRGVFFLTQALLGRIPDGGVIINISSMVSLHAYPSVNAYSMSKAAVNAFTRSLAADLGPRGIRVNAVAPGATDSDFLASIRDNAQVMSAIAGQTAFGRLGQPGEVAQVVRFLASPAGAWITGQVIQASGGMHL